MPGFGFGFGVRAGGKRGPADGGPPKVIPPQIVPSAAWTGVAGSGVASAPVDPARTTAKPALRLITPPDLYFTDTLLVGVTGGANDRGTLYDTLGIAKVVVHYEGSSVEVAAPSFQTFPDANGVMRTYYGWWVQLKRDGRNGDARAWFEAVPRDPAMQSRVIGPYTWHPAAQVHDITLEVAPSLPVIAGQRYQSFKAAGDYCRSNARQNPLIVFTEGGTHGMQRLGGGYVPKGRVTLTATQPIVLTRGDTDINDFRMLCPLHVKGANIAIDLKQCNQFVVEAAAAQNHLIDGATVTDSGGVFSYYFKQLRSSSTMFNSNVWLTEARIDNLMNAMVGANLARGVLSNDCFGDLFTGARCVIGCDVRRQDDAPIITGFPAVSITYTGAGATATVEATGSPRTFTFKVGGTTVGTFACNTAITSTNNYEAAHLVAYVNGLAGWSATLLDNRVYANALSLQTGTAGASFAPQSVKGATLTLNGRFDLHGDWMQGGGSNVVVCGNVATNLRVQGFFTDQALTDAVVLNNAFHNNEEPYGIYLVANSLAQIGNTHAHVVFAHNSFATQKVLISGTRDSYCLFRANTAPQLNTLGNTPVSNVGVIDSHLQAGANPTPGGIGTTIGGTAATLFADAGGGNFAPRGELAINAKTAVVRYDRLGAARGKNAPAGALA